MYQFAIIYIGCDYHGYSSTYTVLEDQAHHISLVKGLTEVYNGKLITEYANKIKRFKNIEVTLLYIRL